MTAAASAQAAPLKRISGFDSARALAIFGMVIVNFKIAMDANSGHALLLQFSSLFEGRASALFVVLAGIGLSVLTHKARAAANPAALALARSKIFKRGLLLLLLGLLYTPLWEADILHFYGAYFLCAAAVFHLKDSHLLTLATACILTFPLLLVLGVDYEKNWLWDSLQYQNFWTLDGMLRHLLFNGFHPVVPWLSFLIFGMWLARQDLKAKALRLKLAGLALLTLCLCELGSEALMWLFQAELSHEELEFLFSTTVIPPMPLYILSAASSAVLIIVACLFFSERFGNSRLQSWLSQTGQLSLSLYVAHVIIGMGTLEAFGYLKHQSIEFSLLSAVAFCLAGMVFSVIWLRYFKAGPLEALFRKLAN